MSLWDPIVPVGHVASLLDANHYLGAARRGFAWQDEYGVLVLANPSSRNIPTDWLELIRWCLNGTPNGGSRQWKAVVSWLREHRPDVSTVLSYSDPAVGHTGALYRACNWLWAPTWHRLRPPPSGNGAWIEGEQESVKDRWVYPLAVDRRRQFVLRVNDSSLRRRFPDAEYREPRIRRGRIQLGTGGGKYRPFEVAEVAA